MLFFTRNDRPEGRSNTWANYTDSLGRFDRLRLLLRRVWYVLADFDRPDGLVRFADFCSDV